MEDEEWRIVWFTLGISALSIACILPFGVAAGWLLARPKWPGKIVVETLLSLPMVLPPVATGLILLKLFGRNGPIGAALERLGIDVVFTWKAVVIALGTMAFPFLVRAVRVGFETVNPRVEQVARTLGAGPWRVFWTISLPLAKRGVIAGIFLAFARALGEFGATILVAGAIPGKTATISVSIFNFIQLGKDESASHLLLISVVIAFGFLYLSELLLQKRRLP